MAGYSPSNVTSELIQQFLDENTNLIMNILNNKNSGNMSDIAANQAKLHRNLMYLASIADGQFEATMLAQQQHQSGLMTQSTPQMQQQQVQQMTPQPMIPTWTSQSYPHSPTMLQQQQAAMQQGQPDTNIRGIDGSSMLRSESSRSRRSRGNGRRRTKLRGESSSGPGGMKEHNVLPGENSGGTGGVTGSYTAMLLGENSGGVGVTGTFSAMLHGENSSVGLNDEARTDFTLSVGRAAQAMPNPGSSAEEQAGSSGGQTGNAALLNFLGGPEERGN